MVFPLLWFWPPHVAHISHRSASTITSFRTTRRAQPIQRAQFPLSCARGMSYTPTSRLAGAEDTTPVLPGAVKKWGINEEEYTQRVQRHRLVVRSPSWITEILNFGLFFSQFSLVFKKTSGRWRSGTPGTRRGKAGGPSSTTPFSNPCSKMRQPSSYFAMEHNLVLTYQVYFENIYMIRPLRRFRHCSA